MKKKDIVFAIVLVAVTSVGVYQITTLRAELAQQRTEIDSLNEFVEAQAEALTVCQNAMSGLTDWAINKSTLGMLGSATDILTQMGECSDAVSRFNLIATTS